MGSEKEQLLVICYNCENCDYCERNDTKFNKFSKVVCDAVEFSSKSIMGVRYNNEEWNNTPRKLLELAMIYKNEKSRIERLKYTSQ